MVHGYMGGGYDDVCEGPACEGVWTAAGRTWKASRCASFRPELIIAASVWPSPAADAALSPPRWGPATRGVRAALLSAAVARAAAAVSCRVRKAANWSVLMAAVVRAMGGAGDVGGR